MKTKRTRRNKGKELIAVATVCVLSIGVFSGAYIALNEQIFARATSEPTLLDQSPAVAVSEDYAEHENESVLEYSPAVATSYTYTGAEYAVENEPGEFVVPTLTVMASTDQESAIPAVAMSMEEAAQTGAKYIWDVFGANIDGMYVRMFYGDHASQMNTWWVGNVFVENPDYPTQSYIVHPFTYEKRALPIYTFVINAITGQRIDVSYISPQGRSETVYMSSQMRAETVPYAEFDEVMSFRWALLESGWFDMELYEQIELLGISDEALETYLQTAKKLAEAQFNTTGVSNVRLDTFWANGMIDGEVDLATIVFVALDNTGREAIITISASDAVFQNISISTQHNDFVPGFEFYYPGGGVG